MGFVTLLVFSLGLATTYGKKCADISGQWQNELGSRMIIHVDDADRISGEYYTAVESKPGAAAVVSNLKGLFSRQSDGSILTFSVLFNHGTSLASWVGQCMICDDKEILRTTYMLRSYKKDRREQWNTITMNQNSFWRVQNDSESAAVDSSNTESSTFKPISVVSQTPPGGSEISGKWQSSDNEEIEITEDKGHLLEGRTTCCHQTSKFQGKHHSTGLVGIRDGKDLFTAVSLMTTSNKRVKSWTGHIYDSSVPKTLETSWVEYEYNPSCAMDAGRNNVKFGVQKFTQTAAGAENIVNKSETFMDKLRKFFSSMF